MREEETTRRRSNEITLRKIFFLKKSSLFFPFIFHLTDQESKEKKSCPSYSQNKRRKRHVIQSLASSSEKNTSEKDQEL